MRSASNHDRERGGRRQHDRRQPCREGCTRRLYDVDGVAASALAQIPTLYKHPLYEAATDFAPVALVTDSARVLITRKDFPADNFKEFVAYAKSHQDNMKYGTAGVGSGAHICAILLDQALGTKITQVPYRGTAPAMQDSIGGRIDLLPSRSRPRCRRSRAKPSRRSRRWDRSCARSGGSPDRRRARLSGPRLRRLGRIGFSQGHAGSDRAPHGQGRK